MIRVAAGEPLSIKQSDIELNGWAIEETVVYAEDPYRNFAPSIGRLVRYRRPQPAERHPRRDHGARRHRASPRAAKISLKNDPMIAKLVTQAPTRLQASMRRRSALDAFTIEGIRHNIPFSRRDHAESCAGVRASCARPPSSPMNSPAASSV